MDDEGYYTCAYCKVEGLEWNEVSVHSCFKGDSVLSIDNRRFVYREQDTNSINREDASPANITPSHEEGEKTDWQNPAVFLLIEEYRQFKNELEKEYNKWKSLLRTYKNVKDHNNETGRNRKNWTFFTLIDEIMNNNPEIEPPVLLCNGVEQTPTTSNHSPLNSRSSTPTIGILNGTWNRKELLECGLEIRHRQNFIRLTTQRAITFSKILYDLFVVRIEPTGQIYDGAANHLRKRYNEIVSKLTDDEIEELFQKVKDKSGIESLKQTEQSVENMPTDLTQTETLLVQIPKELDCIKTPSELSDIALIGTYYIPHTNRDPFKRRFVHHQGENNLMSKNDRAYLALLGSDNSSVAKEKQYREFYTNCETILRYIKQKNALLLGGDLDRKTVDGKNLNE
ncbi:hypothetical protein FQR65_LT15649 [Abscondita terminalis]|nr:hypothetical protein FQR65_LT15649 [Abscondita terminalis]